MLLHVITARDSESASLLALSYVKHLLYIFISSCLSQSFYSSLLSARSSRPAIIFLTSLYSNILHWHFGHTILQSITWLWTLWKYYLADSPGLVCHDSKQSYKGIIRWLSLLERQNYRRVRRNTSDRPGLCLTWRKNWRQHPRWRSRLRSNRLQGSGGISQKLVENRQAGL